MVSIFTPNISLEEPGLGDYVNGWNVPLNSNFSIVDQVMGASTTIALSNSNVSLTIQEAAFATIILSGGITTNLTLTLPATLGGRRYIWNQTSGAFTVTVLNGSSDPGGGVAVPQGLITPVILTNGQAFYDSYQAVPPGAMSMFAGVAPPPGWLFTVGQSLSTSAYPLLFAAIGYTFGGSGSSFTLPDTRGCVLAAPDNMGGTPAGRLTGLTLGGFIGAQTHTMSVGEMPSHSHTDAGHAHGVTDAGHSHTANSGNQFVETGGGTSGSLSAGTGLNVQSNTATATTGVVVNSGTANLQNTGGGSAFTIVQPTIAINHIIRF